MGLRDASASLRDAVHDHEQRLSGVCHVAELHRWTGRLLTPPLSEVTQEEKSHPRSGKPASRDAPQKEPATNSVHGPPPEVSPPPGQPVVLESQTEQHNCDTPVRTSFAIGGGRDNRGGGAAYGQGRDRGRAPESKGQPARLQRSTAAVHQPNPPQQQGKRPLSAAASGSRRTAQASGSGSASLPVDSHGRPAPSSSSTGGGAARHSRSGGALICCDSPGAECDDGVMDPAIEAAIGRLMQQGGEAAIDRLMQQVGMQQGPVFEDWMSSRAIDGNPTVVTLGPAEDLPGSKILLCGKLPKQLAELRTQARQLSSQCDSLQATITPLQSYAPPASVEEISIESLRASHANAMDVARRLLECSRLPET